MRTDPRPVRLERSTPASDQLPLATEALRTTEAPNASVKRTVSAPIRLPATSLNAALFRTSAPGWAALTVVPTGTV